VKAFIVIALVVALILGGLLALRSARNAGMPSQDVLDRARKRAREQEAADKD